MFRFVLACSQTLYFPFKVHPARVIKNQNRGGFADRQRKVFGVGKEKIFYISFSRSALVLARRCSRKERKEKENNVCVQASFNFFSRFVLFMNK